MRQTIPWCAWMLSLFIQFHPDSCQIDSAAVMIVENPGTVDVDVTWRVGEPILQIGGGIPNVQQQLFNVKGAIRSSSGAVLLANSGTDEILLFGKDGVLIRIIGREGEGPGEFKSIAGVQHGVQDSLYVFDSGQQRISAFTDDGTLAWDENVGSFSRPFSSMGRFGDGRWWGKEEHRVLGGRRGTLSRDSVGLVFFDEHLREPRVVRTVPGPLGATFSGIRGETGKMVAPFSPQPIYDEYRTCLYFSSGDDFDISILGSHGRLVGIIRNPWEREAVRSEAVEAWIDARLDPVPEQVRPHMRQTLSDVPRPDQLPSFSGLVVDALGYVWLQKYVPPDGPGREWIVFRPDGILLGKILMPRVLELYEVGADYILGKWTTASGEEAISLYPLQRGGEATSERNLCADLDTLPFDGRRIHKLLKAIEYRRDRLAPR